MSRGQRDAKTLHPGSVIPEGVRADATSRRDEWVCSCGGTNSFDKASCRECCEGSSQTERAAGAGKCAPARPIGVNAQAKLAPTTTGAASSSSEAFPKERLCQLEGLQRAAKELGDDYQAQTQRATARS